MQCARGMCQGSAERSAPLRSWVARSGRGWCYKGGVELSAWLIDDLAAVRARFLNAIVAHVPEDRCCLLYTSPSPRD